MDALAGREASVRPEGTSPARDVLAHRFFRCGAQILEGDLVAEVPEGRAIRLMQGVPDPLSNDRQKVRTVDY
jgi:hypothetical protein